MLPIIFFASSPSARKRENCSFCDRKTWVLIRKQLRLAKHSQMLFRASSKVSAARNAMQTSYCHNTYSEVENNVEPSRTSAVFWVTKLWKLTRRPLVWCTCTQNKLKYLYKLIKWSLFPFMSCYWILHVILVLWHWSWIQVLRCHPYDHLPFLKKNYSSFTKIFLKQRLYVPTLKNILSASLKRDERIIEPKPFYVHLAEHYWSVESMRQAWVFRDCMHENMKLAPCRCFSLLWYSWGKAHVAGETWCNNVSVILTCRFKAWNAWDKSRHNLTS